MQGTSEAFMSVAPPVNVKTVIFKEDCPRNIVTMTHLKVANI